jgi:spore germination protein YaaH
VTIISQRLKHPIFYDARHCRWRTFNCAAGLIGAILLFILVVANVVALIHPTFPSQDLKPARSALQAHYYLPPQTNLRIIAPQEPSSALAKKEGTSGPAKAQAAGVAPAGAAPRTKSEMIGFYVNWDESSFISLEQNLSRFDRLIPEWLHLTQADGTIDVDDWSKQAKVIQYLHQHRPNLRIIPLINNFNARTQEWDGRNLGKMLENPAARRRTIQNLLAFVRSYGFAGICIDFEKIDPESRLELREFMRELYERFRGLRLDVSQAVPLADPSFDYQEAGKSCDSLILMAYDEHGSTGRPGPVASQRWYSDGLRQRFAEWPSDKYIIAMGNYGYDWQVHKMAGKAISFQEAIKTAQEYKGHIRVDPGALNPTFDYTDEKGWLRRVWFLDAVTTFNQLVEGQRHRPRGFALWRLGSEDPAVWPILDRRTRLNRSAAETLRTLRYCYDTDSSGGGEGFKEGVASRHGLREIIYDEGPGLITGGRVISYPSPCVTKR